MNSMMRDYLMRRRDGRNPYGSEGGYVVSSRRGRGDMARGRRDYAQRNMGNDYTEYPSRYSDSENERLNQQRMPDMAQSGRQYDGHYEPIEIMGRFNGYYGGMDDYARGGRGRDYNYGDDYARGGRMDYNYNDDYARGRGRDYNYGNDYARNRDYGYMPYYPYYMDYGYGRDYAQNSEYLSDKDLKMWADKLMKNVEEKDKQFLSRENIRKRADEMGIKFEKYSFEEFYVVVLMKYTDHCKTLGTANMDIYLKLAKDFFEDEDTNVRYGEKLAAYYDYIVEGM